MISLLHPVRLRPTTLPQLSKGLAHSLVPYPLGRLLASIALAHFFISISLMYMLSVITAPDPNPVANATRTMLNVSMSVSYSSEGSSSTYPYSPSVAMIRCAMNPTDVLFSRDTSLII